MTTKSGTKGSDATQRMTEATEGYGADEPARQIFTAHQVHTLAHLVYRHLTSAPQVATGAPFVGPTDSRPFSTVPHAPWGGAVSAHPAPAPLRTLFYWYP